METDKIRDGGWQKDSVWTAQEVKSLMSETLSSYKAELTRKITDHIANLTHGQDPGDFISEHRKDMDAVMVQAAYEVKAFSQALDLIK